jgi:hypothetical protein
VLAKPDCNELLRKRNECYLLVAATVDSLNTIQAHVLKSWNFLILQMDGFLRRTVAGRGTSYARIAEDLSDSTTFSL